MYELFYNQSSFNANISGWDVSNVTTMESMFEEAYAFNQPIGNWDVSEVTAMDYMFYNATDFSQNLSTWCVVKVSDYTDFNTDSGLTPAQLPKWTGQPVASCFA
jgi:surface protein